MMCSVEGCESPAHAGGLCGRHYMRQRRTGSPITEPRSAGRPKAEWSRTIDRTFGEWSPRTRARFKAAMRLARDLGFDAEEVQQRFVRPNGSVRVAAFEQAMIELLAAMIRQADLAREDAAD